MGEAETTKDRTNSPTGTWRLASYQRVERRTEAEDRRDAPRPRGDRRSSVRRALRSLLRL